MSNGYVYCMSNPAMPGLVKIGYTERVMSERIQEANQSTWVPQEFSVEFAKFVKEPNAKEQIVHRILSADRVNSKREFFKTTPERVRMLFELMDGPWWDGEETSEPETRVMGDDIIRLFLDKYVYPPTGDGQAVTWGVLAATFQTWKRESGITQGNVMKLKDRITDVYGRPNRGEGWTSFSLRVPGKTDE
jgi:hypothetical protein